MKIDNKVEEYKQLKKSKKAIEKRLADLKEQIVPYLVGKSVCGLEAQERNLTTYNEEELCRLMVDKGIRNSMWCSYKIDEDKIEQLYLDGVLTDNDLRRIRVPKYTYALVEVVEDECISQS